MEANFFRSLTAVFTEEDSTRPTTEAKTITTRTTVANRLESSGLNKKKRLETLAV
ncbi:hypothetical protein KIN20_018389 [Parelaphostrongylus tenuis]|uniref:Uncharacterized protein n=1 Tax=Parelaphostrongylus tenuis TaxID=148309 RepID=A0AAD5N103_PARTN|nr:hypothetical protein KIN20_018389 [Parelaphostrongylus tenuis]